MANEYELFIVEAVFLEEGEDGKRHRVGQPVYQGHSSVSYAATAANKFKFETPDVDPANVITNVYATRKLKWVGKENGYYS